ncbi:MAG: guanylate kinase [Taibaiella sp.]|nr:guanylate kinase [Taibaiella sp.]
MNKILIITAPSGAGKSTITKRLLQQFPKIRFSISACTRAPRGEEQNGVDYYFISVADFQNKIHNNDFVEWEMVYEGKYYGTLKSELERIWHNDELPLFDIDVKGALKVKKQYGADAVSIFIKAPSIAVLRARLEARDTDSPEAIEERINKASFETSFADQFDHIVVNDDLDEAVHKISTIVQSIFANT